MSEPQWIELLPADAIIGGVDVYVWTQNNPVTVWGPIPHGFGRLPLFGVKNSAGDFIDAGVQQIDEQTLTLTFVTPTSGRAYLR